MKTLDNLPEIYFTFSYFTKQLFFPVSNLAGELALFFFNLLVLTRKKLCNYSVSQISIRIVSTPMQRGKLNLLTNVKTPSPVHCYKASYFSIKLRETDSHICWFLEGYRHSFICSGKNLNIQETEVAKQNHWV